MDFSYFLTDYLTMGLVGIVLISFIALCIHYGVEYMRLGCLRTQEEDDHRPLPPVSVILTVHNDADWLKENLPYLLEQDYPDYELVVVDFVSCDETQFILQLCAEHYERLKIVKFSQDANHYQGKKYPFSIGIQSAKNDHILISEPDCVPKDFTWIRSMMRGYRNEEVKMVLGFCGIRQKKSLFNWLQVYDNLTYSLRYLSAGLRGRPYTGCLRNLSFRRSFFFERGAFYAHLSFAEGADDIFVNQNATRDNTRVVIAPDSYTLTESRPTFRAWYHTRRERTATRRFYPIALRLRLLFYPLMVLLFYGAGATLAVLQLFPWEVLLAVLVVKWIWQIVAMSFATKRFDAKGLHWFAPLFEIYFFIANTFSAITPLSLRGKRTKGVK